MASSSALLSSLVQIGAVGLLSVSPSPAATIVRDTVFDLGGVAFPTLLFSVDGSPFAPVTLNTGDVFVLNISFANGAALRVTDIGAPLEGISAIGNTICPPNLPGQPACSGNELVEFFGVSGDLSYPVFSSPNWGGNGIFVSVHADLTSTWFSFSGMRVTWEITSASGVTLDRFDEFGGAAFNQAPTALFDRVDAVPEPGSLSLFAIGLVSLGLVVRRRGRF